MNTYGKTIFLAANSGNGFISFFEDYREPDDGWYTYTIKGGPGTGKSTAMKTVADALLKNGTDVWVCPCSSDPNSLDAVIVPEKKAVIFDGTAPHVIEPKYIGATDKIVNFGEAFDFKKLKSKRKEIIEVSKEISNTYKRIYRYTSILGNLKNDNITLANKALLTEKAEAYATRIAKKYLPKKNTLGKEKNCFLSALTFKGDVAFCKTAENSAQTLIAIDDEYLCASNVFMNVIKNFALKNGYNILNCRNSILPNKTEHIIIPELSLAFVRTAKDLKFENIAKKIHSRRFYDMTVLQQNKEKLLFNNRAYRKIAEETVEVMAQAKQKHDDLETLYSLAVDFGKINTITNSLLNDIISM